jgi:hypothetical protein
MAMATADGATFGTGETKTFADSYLSYTVGTGIGFLYECMDV